MWAKRAVWLLAVVVTLSVDARTDGFIIRPNDPSPWLSTASGSRSGNGAPATLTWSIVPDGASVRTLSGFGSSPSNLISFMNSNFAGSSSQQDLTQQPWFHIFDESFSRWEQLGGVNYVYESHDDGVFHPSQGGVLGVRGDIRIGGITMDGSGGTLAFTYLPVSGGDMAVDTGEAGFFTNSSNNFRNFRNTLMHEIGHSFGLDHVESTSNLLMEPFINASFDGPQLDEVRGVQYYFGDPNEKSNSGQGNATAALATSLGTIVIGSTKTIGASANVPGQAISAAATDFVSIANEGDADYYSFTVSQPSRLSVTLTPRGGVFTQAGEDETPATFDANARSNLALAIFGTNGISQLALADSTPAGGIESLSDLALSNAGTYFARITGADQDRMQMYDLSLSVVALLPGDYNHDHLVDAADYTLWRNTLGQTGVGLAADGNGDGRVDTNDYTIWKTHYGQAAGSGTAVSGLSPSVPEPVTGVMLVTAIFVCLIGHRPTSRNCALASPSRRLACWSASVWR